MKKVFTILALVTMVLLSATQIEAKTKHNYYSDAMIVKTVKKVSKHKYKVTFITQGGYKYSINTDDGDFRKNDLFSFIMDDNGTNLVKDDKIISYRYSGYISKKEAKKWIK